MEQFEWTNFKGIFEQFDYMFVCLNRKTIVKLTYMEKA